MKLLYDETLPGGGHWSAILRRGRCLRVTDPEGGANVALLAFNATEKSERLNLPDSLKCQHTARITAGHCLYSDMGHVLLCVTADSAGWHDPIGGISTADEIRARYGEGNYQTLRNGFHRNGRDNLLVELGKWGLGPADLVMNLNLFSRLDAGADGELRWHPQPSPACAHVDLFAPMDTLVVLTALQHPMDPATTYAPKPVQLGVYAVDDTTAATAACRSARPENGRGLMLTERLYL